MPISQVGSLVLAATSDGDINNHTVPLSIPACSGVQLGDMLLCAIGVQCTAPPNAPSGWTLLGSSGVVSSRWAFTSRGLYVYSKTATGSEPANYAWSLPGSAPQSGNLVQLLGVNLAYRGTDPATPINASAVNGSSAPGPGNTTTSTVTLTATRTGRLVWFCNVSSDPTSPSGGGMPAGFNALLNTYVTWPTSGGGTNAMAISTGDLTNFTYGSITETSTVFCFPGDVWMSGLVELSEPNLIVSD